MNVPPVERGNEGRVIKAGTPPTELHQISGPTTPGREVEARCGLRFTISFVPKTPDEQAMYPRCQFCFPPTTGFAISA
jgi:hypothetical protein